MGYINKSKPDPGIAIEDLEALIDMCDQLIEDAEEGSNSGQDFAASVRDGAESMLETITRSNKVSSRQTTTINNWTIGIERWL